MPDNNATLYTARPEINVEGSPNDALNAALYALEIYEDHEGMSRCELTFNNWGPRSGEVGFLFFDRDVIEFGKTFSVKLGDDTLYEGRVSAIEGDFVTDAAPRVIALLEDKLQDLRMTRRTRSFDDSSDADIIRSVANDHGLQPQIDLQGPTYPAIAQVNLSDLAFLQQRAACLDAELWVEGSTLHARQRGSDSASPLRLSRGAELWELHVSADLASQRTAIKVSGWDVANKDVASHEATDSVIQGDLGDDEGGASLLSSKFAERKEVIAHQVACTSDEARTYAEAAFRAMARRFVTGRATAKPDARLRAGRKVEVAGAGDLFDGTYLLTAVRFVYDLEEGLRVELTMARPGLGRRSS